MNLAVLRALQNCKSGREFIQVHGIPTTSGLTRSYASKIRQHSHGTRITSAYLGNWVKKLMIQCGIDKPGSCHLFRHSCATDMHRGGADIRYVQEMLGHTRMETTQIYTHVHINALREIHTRCHLMGEIHKKETKRQTA